MKRSGFTLIELMIATTLGSFVAIGIYTLLRSQTRATTSNTESSMLMRSGQQAKFVLELDLSQAGFDPLHPDSPATPITTATNDRVVVQGDFNLSSTIGDAQPNESPETIDYTYDAD